MHWLSFSQQNPSFLLRSRAKVLKEFHLAISLEYALFSAVQVLIYEFLAQLGRGEGINVG